jgi:hypothetical protein
VVDAEQTAPGGELEPPNAWNWSACSFAPRPARGGGADEARGLVDRERLALDEHVDRLGEPRGRDLRDDARARVVDVGAPLGRVGGREVEEERGRELGGVCARSAATASSMRSSASGVRP